MSEYCLCEGGLANGGGCRDLCLVCQTGRMDDNSNVVLCHTILPVTSNSAKGQVLVVLFTS
jgi:hypothetical protein